MGNNSIPKFIFRLSRFPVYRGSVLGRFYCTYWLEKALKMITFYVNALLCTLQHIVIHAMQLSGVNSRMCKKYNYFKIFITLITN